MFGDETWSKISPVQFLREDPTSSFYVTDYTQVEKKKEKIETVSIHTYQFVSEMNYASGKCQEKYFKRMNFT